MELIITPATFLDKIQDEFSRNFPHLKLAFYKDYQGERRLTIDERINGSRLLAMEVSQKEDFYGKFNFDGTMTVYRFEKLFLDKFGLIVQVFRKSANLWLVTAGTDLLTLNDQEQIGREMTLLLERSEPVGFQQARA